MGKPIAVEYVTPDGRVRGWFATCSRPTGHPLTAIAVQVAVPGQSWVVEVKYAGLYGWRGVEAYRSLCRARMMVLGGNGHLHRGHSTITAVRPMSLPNVLALTAGPAGTVRDRMAPPWLAI